jgi:hypothetical protein
MSNELEDEETWPDSRIEQAERELAAEKQRREAAKAAAKPDVEKQAEFEKAVSARVGGREFVRKNFGYDPGWPE